MTRKFKFVNEDFIFLKDLIKKAGDLAGSIQKTDISISRKSDTSIVTRADIEVQELLIKELSHRYPEAVFIHEENFDRSTRLLTEDTLSFIIDPIDGTAMFSMYLPLWCISIGVFFGFQPIYGLVYSPGCDMLYYNDNEHAYLNGKIVTVDPDIPFERETNLFYGSEITGILSIDFPGKIRNLGSTALHASLTTDSRRNRVIAFIGEAFLWDWAGAIPVVKKAGGTVRYLSGGEPDFREIINNDYRFPEYLIAACYHDFSAVQNIFKKIN